MNAWIVGSGLAGATCCHELRKHGVASQLFEMEERWGGLVRSARLRGVIYEPHGTHVMHTDDEEVWDLVNSLIPWRPYEHSVLTWVRGRQLTWPIQRQEIIDLYGYEEVAHHDALALDADPRGKSFEDWCLSIMPPVVYDDFIKPYTEKQWGCSADKLDASFAPKRVQVRDDGDKRLFKDRFQGFPDGSLEFGWDDLMRELLAHNERSILTMNHIKLQPLLLTLREHPAAWRPELIVLTCPLDDFAHFELGRLDWRGLDFEHKWYEDEFKQPCTVVNFPGKEWRQTRSHETKHASGQQVRGTVVSQEYPGGRGRYYPVPAKDGINKRRNETYKEVIAQEIGKLGPKVIFTGRLASFKYQDTDEVMRDALDAVRSFLKVGDRLDTVGGLR